MIIREFFLDVYLFLMLAWVVKRFFKGYIQPFFKDLVEQHENSKFQLIKDVETMQLQLGKDELKYSDQYAKLDYFLRKAENLAKYQNDKKAAISEKKIENEKAAIEAKNKKLVGFCENKCKEREVSSVRKKYESSIIDKKSFDLFMSKELSRLRGSLHHD